MALFADPRNDKKLEIDEKLPGVRPLWESGDLVLTAITFQYIEEDRALFAAADSNNNACLDEDEYFKFSHPEEHPEMAPIVTKQTLLMKDKNKDGHIDLAEYIGDTGMQPHKHSISL